MVYGYDLNFNRVSEKESESGVETKNKTLVYDARNQLASISDSKNPSDDVLYTYDANGNQISKTKNSVQTDFVYDVRDQLASVSEGGTNQGNYLYAHNGLRIEKQGARGIERYTYDDQSVLLQKDGNDTLTARFDYGANRLLSLKETGKDEEFYLFDALGSPVNLTTATGTITSRKQYDAWGNKRSESGDSFNRFGFTGHEEDTETGLIYAKARYYDPDTGRFLNQDAFEGYPDTPPSLHKYLYAYGNPTVWVDPTGNYNEGGHFYTTYYIAREVGYDHAQAQELAFYSQVADETGDLDAVEQASDSVFIRQAGVKENMEVTQKREHSLTGGSASKERGEASNAILSTTDNAEAGLQIHRLADAYSHAEVDKAGKDTDKLYDTGAGHGSKGTAPDEIHRRKGQYTNYTDNLARVLAERKHGKGTEGYDNAIKGASVARDKYLSIASESEKANTRKRRVQGNAVDHKKADADTISGFRSRTLSKYSLEDDALLAPEEHGLGHYSRGVKKLITGFRADTSEDINDFVSTRTLGEKSSSSINGEFDSAQERLNNLRPKIVVEKE